MLLAQVSSLKDSSLDDPLENNPRPMNTILVVDDLVENIRILTKILTPAGYQVRKALSGASALRSISQARPDLILLDIMMPEVDGYEVCRHIKREPDWKDIPIIFISALDAIQDRVKGFELGGVDYISKPFHASEVLARIKTHLHLYQLQKKYQAQAKILEKRNERLKTEIDDRKQAEAKYQSIFQNATEGIFQTTRNGRYLTANPALAAIYGYQSPQELIATIQDIGHQIYVEPSRREELTAYLARYGKVVEAVSQVYQQDGTPIWITENVREVRDTGGAFQYYEGTVQDITERVKVEQLLATAQRRSEDLLLNILPKPIVQRLKTDATIIADNLDKVSVLFADLVNFTPFAATVESSTVVDVLNQIFSAFDALVDQYGLQKIKTIGDAYMVGAGVPIPRPDHLEAIARLALDMRTAITQFQRSEQEPFALRIGIHSGPVVAGVIGKKTLAFDIWGHAVNLASRMQETSLPGKIQVSVESYHQLKENFNLERRGVLFPQGIGPVETYFLESAKASSL